jgi:hypothetical protein
MTVKRGRLLAAGAVLLLLATPLLVNKLTLPGVPRQPSHQKSVVPSSKPALPLQHARAVLRSDLAPSEGIEADQPIVDSIGVDKTEVCRGEQNFVNIAARTTNSTDAYLSASMVDPATRRVVSGSRIPFKLYEPLAGALSIVVQGRGGSTKVVQMPWVEVKECDVGRHVAVQAAHLPGAPDRVVLTASVLDWVDGVRGPGAAPGESTYEWDFGDGRSARSSEASIEHSYEDRDQSHSQSSFAASVVVKSPALPEIAGATSITFPNLGFLPLVTDGRVAISVGVRPPDPPAAAHEQIWLYHGYPGTVEVSRAVLRETVLDPATGGERETFRRNYSAAALLGNTTIPSKESLVLRDLSDMQPTEDGAVRYVDLEGRTSDGRVAFGSFTLLPAAKIASAN